MSCAFAYARIVIRIRERYYRGDVDTVKSQASERDPELGYLMEMLRDIYPGTGHDEDFVFSVQTHTNEKKPRVTRDDRDINQHFLRPAATALGVYHEGFGFHSFRREAITNIAKDAGAVQAMLAAGHRHLDMTMVYALHDSKEQKRAVEAAQERILKVVPMRKGA